MKNFVMNSSKDKIEAIASAINNTRENLKPLSINFIFWGVFNLSWIYIIALSFTLKSFHPVPPILFLLGMMLIITGLIIKFKPITLGGIFLTIFTFYLNFNPGINLLLVNIIGVSLGILVPGLSLFYSKSGNKSDE